MFVEVLAHSGVADGAFVLRSSGCVVIVRYVLRTVCEALEFVGVEPDAAAREAHVEWYAFRFYDQHVLAALRACPFRLARGIDLLVVGWGGG